jgi:hypothetical protein
VPRVLKSTEEDQLSNTLILDTDMDKLFAELRHAILTSHCDPESLKTAMQSFSIADLGSFRALQLVLIFEVSEEIGRRKQREIQD